MSGEFEAAGALATAGLAAGAIEGREGGQQGEGGCANCGAPLQGAYCHACGQAAHPHRSLVHVFEEFLHGILHFDTKAWRTLPMLAFRPGTLTRGDSSTVPSCSGEPATASPHRVRASTTLKAVGPPDR